MRALLALLLAAGWTAAQAPEAATPNTGRLVRGRLVDPSRDAPVRGATVSLRTRAPGERGPGAVTGPVFTDAEGRFRIADVAPGEHILEVGKPGFETRGHGVLVPATGDFEPLDVEMQRQAVVAGRVLDARGNPLPGASVLAYAPTDDGGYRNVAAQMRGGGVETDDRGEYRLFGLRAGSVVIAAKPAHEPASSGAAILRHRPQVWPAADRFADATPIELAWGEVREGVDFRLPDPPDTLVVGVVEPAPGPDRRASLQFQLEPPSGPRHASLTTRPDGRFVVSGLPPGEYSVTANLSAPRAPSRDWGQATVVVPGSGTVETAIAVRPPVTLPGLVKLIDPPDGLALDAPVSLRLTRPLDGDQYGEPTTQAFFRLEGPETRFTIDVYEGRNAFPRLFVPREAYVARVLLGDEPLTEREFTITADAPPGELVLELRFDFGRVTGVVSGLRPAAQPGLQASAQSPVVMFYDAPPLVDRPPFSVVGPTGAFTIEDVPPGEYVAFAALSGRTNDLRRSPELREKLERYAKRIEVRPGETTTLDLELIPDTAFDPH